MPLYNFKYAGKIEDHPKKDEGCECLKEEGIELLVLSQDELNNAKCPNCGQPVKRIEGLVYEASFQLKGGGWYKDGYSSSRK